MSRYDTVEEEIVPILLGDIPIYHCYGRPVEASWREYPHFAAVKRNGRRIYNVGRFYKARLLRQILPDLKAQTFDVMLD